MANSSEAVFKLIGEERRQIADLAEHLSDGRREALEELSGEGVALLRARFGG